MARPESVFDRADPFSGQSAWSSWAQSVNPGSQSSSFSDWAPSAIYDYGNLSTPGQVSLDPQGRGGMYYGADSVDYGASLISGGIDSYLKQAHPELYSGFQDYGSSSNAGVVSNPSTPKWSAVNNWNAQILAAVQKVQHDTGVYVPPNVVKSIMQIESQGQMLPMNSAGAVGLMQVTGNTIGQYDLQKAATDPAYSVWAGVNELALRYKDGKAIADANKSPFDWSNAAVGYFSGHYTPMGSSDGYSTDYQYQQAFNDNWSELLNDANKQGTAGGTAAQPNTKSFNAIWGGFDAPITQNFGMTDFAQNSDYAKTAYQYTADYTRDRQPMGHAGIDVGVSYGSRLYSPVGGKVTLAGGTGFYCDADGNGCGPQVGELAITYPNGDVLILGHMSQIAVHVGDTIQPGQFVGYSGSENGAHVHVEYRKWVGDGVTNSGYEVQDPSLALSGVFTGAYGAAPGSGPAQAASPNNWTGFLTNAIKGLPLTGTAPGAGGFHDWMFNALMHKPQVTQPGGTPTYLWATTPTGATGGTGGSATGGGGFG